MRIALRSSCFFALTSMLLACGGSDDGSSSTSDSSTSDTASGRDSARTDSSSADSSIDSSSSDSTSSDSSAADTATGDDGAAESSVDASADASDAIDGPAAKCTSDADCRTFSVECDGTCACLALASSEPSPTCTVPTECFADPCLGKTAHCGTGNVCVLE